jgi:ABC transporter DrrB family efflux protein
VLQPKIYPLEQGKEELRRGKISLLVEGDAIPVYRFDATRPDARTARVEVDDALQAAAGRRDVMTAREERVTEKGSRYIDFLVPGLLGMNLMGTGMWGIGFSVVNARLRKLLKRLIATPMRRSHYLLAQIFMRIAFLVLEVGILIIFAWLVFGVRIRGPIALFALICLLGGMAFAGIGLLVASRARTLEAVSGLMNFVMVPMWICSGVFFSYERFPDAAKPFIRALPLTALNDALRGVMNDGFGITQLMPQIVTLIAWGVLSYLIGLKIFRWQ